jgi:hypothetical protein
MYVVGSTIEWCGKMFKVEEVYQLTDEEMRKHELVHRNRVRLRNINDPTDIHDFAIPEVE